MQELTPRPQADKFCPRRIVAARGAGNPEMEEASARVFDGSPSVLRSRPGEETEDLRRICPAPGESHSAMKLIVAIVGPERLKAVLSALNGREVSLLSVSPVMTAGRGGTEIY